MVKKIINKLFDKVNKKTDKFEFKIIEKFF